MRPKDTRGVQGEMFERELATLVRPNHGLVKLSRQIQWERFDEKFGVCYSGENGRPGIPTRLMVGLTYLKYLHNISHEAANTPLILQRRPPTFATVMQTTRMRRWLLLL